MIKQAMDQAYRNARRIAIAVLGGTVLLIGVALMVLPGPAIVVIPLGLAILGLEFAWARNMLRRVRRSISQRSFDPLVRGEDGR
jgi:tellurite resistance protein TerC